MSKFRTRIYKPWILSSLILLAVVLVVWLLFFRHKASGPVIPSTNPVTGNSTSTPASSGVPVTGQNASTTSSGSGTETGRPPTTPYGDFVSNHHPGGSLGTAESSTCNTTAGATCYIKFTNGSTVKQLVAQTVDSRGTTLWYWDIKDAGLTSGSWTVTAVATLNGQTKTAADSLALVVQ